LLGSLILAFSIAIFICFQFPLLGSGNRVSDIAGVKR